MTGVVVGVDVGTGSARAGVFAPDGTLLGTARHSVAMWRPDGVLAEQGSDDIWAAVVAAVCGALAEAGGPTVVGLGACATCSMVVLDQAFRPLAVGDDAARNVIVWMDHRAAAEAAAADATGAEALRHVGGRFSPEMQVPKLMWLRRHAPRIWARAAHFMDLPDFLTWRATGSLARSVCSVACKWGYLAHHGRWDEALYRAAGLDDLADEGFARIGTDIRPLGSAAGVLSAEAAAALGLPAGIPVATSAIDAHAGGIGCLGLADGGEGLTERTAQRRLALIAGTSACHMAVAPAPRFVPGVWGPYLGAMVPGLWLTEGGQSATGALLDHVIASHPARALAGPDPFATLSGRVAALGTRASAGLHVYPDVLGNRSPHADPGLRGMVSGLALSATLDDLARIYLASLQALAYGTKEIVAALNGAGFVIDTLVATGGLAADPAFLRAHADATGCRVVLPAQPESVLLGAAMLAAVAAGAHATVPDAMAAMSRAGQVVAPDPAMRPFHEARARIHARMREDQRAYLALERAADGGA